MEIKGLVHVHSRYSYDGKEDLRSLKDFLLSQNISFCCLTEHTDKLTLHEAQLFAQECKSLSDAHFVFVPGFEVPYEQAHILLIGTEVFLGQRADLSMLTSWSTSAELTILAHPVRNKFSVSAELRSLLDGIEIWNQQYDGKHVPRRRSVRLFENLREGDQALCATGGSDFHRREHFGAPVYTLEVGALTQSAIVDALKKGEYSFGSASVAVSSAGIWQGKDSAAHNLASMFSIVVINAGKATNALLSRMGVRLPKSLARFIRSRV